VLIALTGRAGAGKDSVALVLAAAGWRTVAFADALRTEVAEAWHLLDHRLLTERSTKEQPTPLLAAVNCTYGAWRTWCRDKGHDLYAPRSPRWAMQQWGTLRRSIDDMHWVHPVHLWLMQQRNQGQHSLVVTDLRLDNEADMLTGCHGARIVRVHRPDLPALAPDTAAHESEMHQLIPAHAEVHNAGPLQDLPAEVWRVVHHLARHPAPPIDHDTAPTNYGGTA